MKQKTVSLASSTPWTGSRPSAGPEGWTFDMRFAITQNDAGWITELRLSQEDVTKALLAYRYGADGNVRSSSFDAEDYAHDSLSRLTFDRGRDYQYDDAGNRTRGPGGVLAYEAPSTDRWVSADDGAIRYAMDAAGNVTEREGTVLGYAGDGTVTSTDTQSGVTVFLRDFRSLRVQKMGAGGSGTFTYSPEGELLAWQGPLATVKCTIGEPPAVQIRTQKKIPFEAFVTVGGRRAAVIKSHVETACGGDFFGKMLVDDVLLYFSDKMDLPRGVYRDSDGKLVWSADFTAFADPISLDEDPDGDGDRTVVPFRLPGQFAHTLAEGGPTATAGGLHENWNRVYDSSVGRYLQPDPLGQPADISLYRYAQNRPLIIADPDGRFVVEHDFSGRCKGCKPEDSDWSEGLGIARRAALNPACSDFFRRFNNASLFNLLAEGTPPRLILGSGRGYGHYDRLGNFITVSCGTLFESSPEEVARTLIHELAHYANDAASRFGGYQTTWPWEESNFQGEGYDAELACFGSL